MLSRKTLVIALSLLLACSAMAAVRIFYQSFVVDISEGLSAEVQVS
jgi:hypothetical protein